MGRTARYIDPFGAPEFLVDAVAYREMVGSEMMRLAFFAADNGEQVLRVRLVMPTRQIIAEQVATKRFLDDRGGTAMLARCH